MGVNPGRLRNSKKKQLISLKKVSIFEFQRKNCMALRVFEFQEQFIIDFFDEINSI